MNKQLSKLVIQIFLFSMLGKKKQMKEEKVPEKDIDVLEKAELEAAIKASMEIEVFYLIRSYLGK
jgi:hypothetical protein